MNLVARTPRIEPLEARIAPAFAAVIDLASLPAAQAVAITSAQANDDFGGSVSDAGDINGDHIDDFVIGAFTANADSSGASYIVFGQAGGLSPSISLGSLDGTNGFRINGEPGEEFSGVSVSAAGDVNGDGIGDLIIGASQADANGTDSGAAYVLFGHGGNFFSPMSLSSLIGQTGFKIIGEAAMNNLGASVSGAGDVNGDGFDDVIVGAAGNANTAGAAYVIYGKPGAFSSPINPANLNGLDGVKIFGAGVNARLGASVSGAGDVNGDGLADMVIGAPGLSPNVLGSGGAYVVFGRAGGFNSPLNLSNYISGNNGFVYFGVSPSAFTGSTVGSAGDVNGDGYADLFIGASGDNAGGAASGAAFVVYGHGGTFASPFQLSPFDTAHGFQIIGAAPNDRVATTLHTLGDFNADGFPDLVLGSDHGGPNGTGVAYVVFGRAGGFETLSLSGLDGTNGFKVIGTSGLLSANISVSTAGDPNADGFADLLLGSPVTGAAFVLYGSSGGNTVKIGPTHKTATFTDVDGDLVTIRTTKGPLTANEFTLTGVNTLGGATLRLIDFQGHSELNGTSLSITARPQIIGGVRHGDGLVNIGELDASGLALGNVGIGGDLGQFHLGSGTTVAAARMFVLNSLGLAGLSTQGGANASLTSTFAGTLPVFIVKTSVDGVVVGGGKLGIVRIGGNLTDSQFVLSGVANPKTAAAANVLKLLTVGANFEHSRVLAGFSAFGGNPHVQIGTIRIGGNWVASTVVAGISADADGFYGTADDSVLPGGGTVASRIASIVIKGQALGTFAPGGHFAITAQQIGAVTIGQTRLPLQKLAKDHFLALGSTGDFFLNEV
ncbi:MAG: Ca2+-binding protein toxin-related [Devosia sp.]|uniref:beta strand repeat-containing protein n=1 Tax=Devosia sp. TaxID=1871048 RepID=UPI0026083EB8|nr:integrin alpha [Devosia sp.]MDB5540616.1 Ca2+-binding protein toxin-related [Devosia sp.]